jgi:prophage tail gpP-like protein
MPFKASEIASITVGGRTFRDWESVTVKMVEGESNHSFKLSVSEGAPLTKNFGSLQIKPGDHCTITLGGELAISGYVETRQGGYSATQHGIQIIGHSYNKAAADGAVMHKTMEFKNQPLQQIATSLLKPFGIKFVPKTAMPTKKFPRVNVAPGTSAWHQLDTLARQRQVTLGTDKQGNVTGRTFFMGGGDALIEGKNILEAQEVMTMNMGDGPYNQKSQTPGGNVNFGREAAGPTSKTDSRPLGESSKGVHAPQVALNEHPGDKDDTKARGNMESQRRGQEQLQVTITVQGWHKPSGGLWEPGTKVQVQSPMLLVNESLKLMSATFTQDSKSGTRTTLELTRETKSEQDAKDGKAPYDMDPQNKTGVNDPSDPSGGRTGHSPA